jgi:hypothetical protein
MKYPELNTVLLKIKENPKKYIGERSIKKLKLFIMGYILSQGDKMGECSDDLLRFQKFVQQKYNIKYSVSWSEIIRLLSTSDEHAFYKFYELMDEFHEKNS